MPAGPASVNIVTGIRFAITFVGGTNTFTIAGNYTSMFNTNAILTIVGGTPNGGYQQVASSVFTGGNTVVTVNSYSTGTSYPGPATFTGSGSGSAIWFIPGTFVSPWVRVDGGIFPSDPVVSMGILSTSDAAVVTQLGNVGYTTNGGNSWIHVAAPFANMFNSYSMVAANSTLMEYNGTYPTLFEFVGTVTGGNVLTVTSTTLGVVQEGTFLTGGTLAPGSQITGGSGNTWTIFPSQADVASATITGSYYGGAIQRSTDGGATWTDVTPSQLNSTPYSGGLGSLVGGTGYTNGTYAPSLTGGSGTGATATVVISGGSVVEVDMNGGFGYGYQVGDVLSVNNTDVGGTGSGFSVTITSLYNPRAQGVSQPYYSSSAGAWFMFNAASPTNDFSVWRSTDNGTSWTNIATPDNFATVTGFAYQNFYDSPGNIIVVGFSLDTGFGEVYRSTDGGLTWTNVLTDSNVTYFVEIAKNGGIFNVMGYGTIGFGPPATAYNYTSTDGITWTIQANGTDLTTVPPYITSQVVFDSNFVTGFNTTDNFSIGYSSAGVTWTPVVLGGGGNGLATDASRIYSYGDSIYSSTNLTTWTLELQSSATGGLSTLQTLSTLDLAAGSDLSSNGVIWKRT